MHSVERKEDARVLHGATIAFDLDGTLVHTLPDIARAVNAVLGESGHAPLPPETVRRFVGQGSRVLLARSFAKRGDELGPERLERAYAAFIAHHCEHLVDASALYPGVREALDRLATAGASLSVCTNKPSVLAQGVLRAFGLLDRFAFVAGGDTFRTRKPDPLHLVQTIERAGGDAGRAIMVGDSGTDIATARGAGIPVVAVDFGYSERPVASYMPDAVISHFDALEPVARSLLRGAER